MSSFSCTVEISNSSSSVLSDPAKLLMSWQCSLPLSPLLSPGSDGRASFIGPAGRPSYLSPPPGIDLECLFIYHLPDKAAMLVVWFKVPFESSNGSNDFAVAIHNPTTECDLSLLKLMTKGSEKGPLKATKASVSCNGLVVRATMSDTPNAVLKVNVSNVPFPSPLPTKGVKVGPA